MKNLFLKVLIFLCFAFQTTSFAQNESALFNKFLNSSTGFNFISSPGEPSIFCVLNCDQEDLYSGKPGFALIPFEKIELNGSLNQLGLNFSYDGEILNKQRGITSLSTLQYGINGILDMGTLGFVASGQAQFVLAAQLTQDLIDESLNFGINSLKSQVDKLYKNQYLENFGQVIDTLNESETYKKEISRISNNPAMLQDAEINNLQDQIYTYIDGKIRKHSKNSNSWYFMHNLSESEKSNLMRTFTYTLKEKIQSDVGSQIYFNIKPNKKPKKVKVDISDDNLLDAFKKNNMANIEAKQLARDLEQYMSESSKIMSQIGNSISIFRESNISNKEIEMFLAASPEEKIALLEKGEFKEKLSSKKLQEEITKYQNLTKRTVAGSKDEFNPNEAKLALSSTLMGFYAASKAIEIAGSLDLLRGDSLKVANKFTSFSMNGMTAALGFLSMKYGANPMDKLQGTQQLINGVSGMISTFIKKPNPAAMRHKQIMQALQAVLAGQKKIYKAVKIVDAKVDKLIQGQKYIFNTIHRLGLRHEQRFNQLEELNLVVLNRVDKIYKMFNESRYKNLHLCSTSIKPNVDSLLKSANKSKAQRLNELRSLFSTTLKDNFSACIDGLHEIFEINGAYTAGKVTQNPWHNYFVLAKSDAYIAHNSDKQNLLAFKLLESEFKNFNDLRLLSFKQNNNINSTSLETQISDSLLEINNFISHPVQFTKDVLSKDMFSKKTISGNDNNKLDMQLITFGNMLSEDGPFVNDKEALEKEAFLRSSHLLNAQLFTNEVETFLRIFPYLQAYAETNSNFEATKKLRSVVNGISFNLKVFLSQTSLLSGEAALSNIYENRKDTKWPNYQLASQLLRRNSMVRENYIKYFMHRKLHETNTQWYSFTNSLSNDRIGSLAKHFRDLGFGFSIVQFGNIEFKDLYTDKLRSIIERSNTVLQALDNHQAIEEYKKMSMKERGNLKALLLAFSKQSSKLLKLVQQIDLTEYEILKKSFLEIDNDETTKRLNELSGNLYLAWENAETVKVLTHIRNLLEEFFKVKNELRKYIYQDAQVLVKYSDDNGLNDLFSLPDISGFEFSHMKYPKSVSRLVDLDRKVQKLKHSYRVQSVLKDNKNSIDPNIKRYLWNYIQ